MRNFSSTRGALTAMLAVTVVLFWSSFSCAGTPAPGPDCGTGASIAGSDSAGKMTLGEGVNTANTCTLTFSVPYTNPPACIATNETHGATVGISTTQTGAVMSGPYPFTGGDVIVYICAEY
jgi:hypothetical protein